MEIENMKKIGICILIMTLLISSLAVIIQTVNVKASDDIIYVDDGAKSPFYGTMKHPFKTIQDGVNVSDIGGIVFVYSGSYEEIVFVNKSISLLGEDKLTTKLLGQIHIYSDDVTVSNFDITFDYYYNNYEMEACICSYGDGNTITKNCLFSDNSCCESLYFEGSDIVISNNLIVSGAFEYGGGGIKSGYYVNNDNITITNNTIKVKFEAEPIYIGCSNSTISYNDIIGGICDIEVFGFNNTMRNNNAKSVDVRDWPIDIMPYSYPNVINPESRGVISVAVFTTNYYDSDDFRGEARLLGADAISYTHKDVDKDGDIDLLLKFRISEMNFSRLVDKGEKYPYAYLNLDTGLGIYFSGKDTVKLIGKK